MLHRKGLPIGVIVALLILALATVGVGYGLWSQTLVINGTVNTGNMDAGLSIEEIDEVAYDTLAMKSFNDICPTGGYTIGQNCDGNDGWDDEMEAEGKHVAQCSAVLLDRYTMQVTVENAYPYFNCFIRYNVANTGTIPIHIYHPDYFIGDVYYGAGINTNELHVNAWPPPCYSDGTQLHPGGAAFCNLHVNLRQAAHEGATYTFLVKIWTEQWNEVSGPPWRP